MQTTGSATVAVSAAAVHNTLVTVSNTVSTVHNTRRSKDLGAPSMAGGAASDGHKLEPLGLHV
jgi:hypothetical protein